MSTMKMNDYQWGKVIQQISNREKNQKEKDLKLGGINIYFNCSIFSFEL